MGEFQVGNETENIRLPKRTWTVFGRNSETGTTGYVKPRNIPVHRRPTHLPTISYKEAGRFDDEEK